ncbi:MAG: GCN5-related N-acetyltransferase [Actinomycetia bacterium]|nr:GCN5-related N-acetyltransferase [Actinomycetes bacterium]
MALIVELAAAADTLDLRGRVLRDGRRHEGFPEDDWPETFHLVARDGGAVVGVATFIPRDDGWQLRGMAVAPEVQGRGIGRQLLEVGYERLRSLGATVAWANGRDTALGFYERLGWRVVGDGFVMGSGVAHHRIQLDL